MTDRPRAGVQSPPLDPPLDVEAGHDAAEARSDTARATTYAPNVRASEDVAAAPGEVLSVDASQAERPKSSARNHRASEVDSQKDDLDRITSRLDDDSELQLFPNVFSTDGSKSPERHRRPQPSKPSRALDIPTHKMHKFSLYETQTRYYLVGGDLADEHFRVLKIDRTAPPDQLGLVEDEVIYDKYQMNRLLTTIDQGNRKGGGMKLRGNAWGLLGFIRFTEGYYMLMITKKQQVAMIGGHFIYQVDDTQLVPLAMTTPGKSATTKSLEEQRYLSILHNLDLHRSFYFSYSYNVTQSLQTNVIYSRRHPQEAWEPKRAKNLNDMFVWNHHLLGPAIGALKNPYDWCLPIIHGSVDQSAIDVFGRSVWVTLIARRSRFFAGARFLKRGANDLGYVANDVESEQIVADLETTPLDAPGRGMLKSPNYTSFVQHRGSIPLYWAQDSSGVSPKPGIELNFIDPFYASAALHFDNLFDRYGAPLAVLNLVKARERTPRESKLLVEYENAIAYLNQVLPEDSKIIYRKFDMARAAKTRGQDVISSLETIAHELVRRTSFFHNGVKESDESCVQNGVTRSNCIDCLDRTNACQFVIGKTALALQLQALGIIAGEHINYNSDASNILAHMYNDHGDTLASQYGGSHLVNTTESYRKINNWQSHSRDMLESFKRYYHNSFLDSQRQEAYNLFLGNFRYTSGEPMLWELSTDYWLHHALPSSYFETKRRSYISWYTPKYLEKRTMPPANDQIEHERPQESIYDTEWWHEYYKPDVLTSFSKSFAFRVNSTTRYLPKHRTAPYIDQSPFVVRNTTQEDDTASQMTARANEDTEDLSKSMRPVAVSSPPQANARRIVSLTKWLEETPSSKAQVLNESSQKAAEAMSQQPIATDFKAADRSQMNQWTVEQFHENTLNPVIPKNEETLYEDYLRREVPQLPNKDASADVLGRTYREYIDKPSRMADEALENGTMDDASVYERYLTMVDEPLTIKEDDWEMKRYKVYDRWQRGRGLFKQGSKVSREPTASAG